MASEKKYAQLINQLLAGKRLSRLLVTRSNDATRDVIKGLRVVEVRVDQRTEMSTNALASRQHLGWLRDIAPRRLENQPQHVDLHRGALEQSEILEHVHGHTGLQRCGKYGATDNVGGKVTHRQVEGERLTRCGLFSQRQQVIVNGRLHGAEGMADAHVRERRINHGALTLPALTIGHKNTVSDQVLQRTDHQVAFGKHALGITHDLAHSIGFVKEHRRASGVSQVTNVKVVGSGGQQLKQIAVTLPQHPREGDHRPQRQRLGWDVKLRCGHLNFPTRPMQYGGGI